MEKILLFFDQKSNRRLLRQMLEREFAVGEGDAAADLDTPFDLALFDGPALDRHRQPLLARRAAASPVFLPVLLVTSRSDIGQATQRLWRTCDEVLLAPIEKVELRARVEILLRARRYSQELQSRYLTLATQAPIGVFLLQRGRAVWVNPALEALLGRDGQELIGSPLDHWFLPADRAPVAAWWEQACAGERVETLTVRLPTPTGLRWGELRLRPLPSEAQPTCLGLLTDLTRERELSRMKDEFLATASHELNTPLTSVLGYAELLLADPEIGERRQQMLGQIQRGAAKLARIVQDLLNLAQLRAGGVPLARARLDLAGVLEDLLGEMRHDQAGREFRLHLPAGALPAFADRELLARAIRNLLANAVKFSPPEAPVEVAVEVSPEGYRISVADQGSGMDAAEIGRAMEAFHRGDASDSAVEGFGLGLAVARAVIEAHGGHIELASAAGAGTRASLVLPRGDGAKG